ncbi:hypothetical protein I3842_12G003500 [Carya illinoinensis]|uniref:Uncharacterized protein n=1 Tax=Carya illinoinensis TaxID=32201 RepID=A0A922DF41_CARIL|nr:hypothetical protein I3842_12G003500 [Carya illinoinensis]
MFSSIRVRTTRSVYFHPLAVISYDIYRDHIYGNCVIARLFWEGMEMAREHHDCMGLGIIRRTKFSIGGEPMNTLNVDLDHQAVKNLSAELDVKDVHFLMELIQNAEDPSLELVITCEDMMISPTGAPPTFDKLLSSQNIDSICSFGRPIIKKVGKRKRVYIGEIKAAKCGRYNLLQKFWSTKIIETTLNDRLVTLPVGSDSNNIDYDFQLKDLSERKNIGIVRTTSHESVKKEEESMVLDVAQELMNQVNPKDILIRKGLARLILGFLVDPMLKMEAGHESRHEAMKRLLNTTFIGIVELKASQMMGWDRSEASSMLFEQKVEKSSGYYKNKIEYATYFSQALISEGLLWENRDHDIGEKLSEMIKLCFVLEFNEEAVGFVMKSRNLQIFEEDEEFLASLFPP